MTLDEAIKHCEEVMMKNLEKTKNRNASDPIAISCGECAEEHRQLAEWLKELKQLREQTGWIPVSERSSEDSNDIRETHDIYKIIMRERETLEKAFKDPEIQLSFMKAVRLITEELKSASPTGAEKER